MNTPLVAIHTAAQQRRSTLRAIAVAALVGNALLFGFDVVSKGPNEINVPHVIISLVVAGIAALRFRWAPAFGALLCAGQLVEGYIYLAHILAKLDGAATFTFAALFFAIPVVGLVASIGAIVLNHRAPRSRPLVEPPAPA